MPHRLFALFTLFSLITFSAEIKTNSVHILNAPTWVKKTLVQEVSSKIERKLEWSTKRVTVKWHDTQEELLKTFGREAPTILAFTRKSESTIHMGPKVTEENFSKIFGHELAHAILAQKFKKAVPPWLEEGLVNAVAGVEEIDYKWLSEQPRVSLRSLTHPFDAKTESSVNLHYMASSAAIKMLEKKCASFRELLNLSLRSNMEDYIKTYCKISDIDAAFWKWVDEKTG